jgi:hypothetical protein
MLVGEGTFRGWPWAEQEGAGLGSLKKEKKNIRQNATMFLWAV